MDRRSINTSSFRKKTENQKINFWGCNKTKIERLIIRNILILTFKFISYEKYSKIKVDNCK